ncbi:hypothetical protein TOPH_02802 [Tolypocladium ophioglossoides CBS 100239]|uniref:Uncharacterized protein n=1 Tax=Tolypocladium ophioglossoides (strain CBS 100239) TaxID=1163406 RepID=A0A0L0NFB4_TOLOC|nr:hypothetical protein TOPH_02802 [Tolypocladium ophioglossoides CBS 100239]
MATTLSNPMRDERAYNVDEAALSLAAEKTIDVGHGVGNTLRVTQILEANDITCCCVGVSALKFYGASRMRDDWEICVPTDLVPKAIRVLQSPPHSDVYVLVDSISHAQVQSMTHTYNRFQTRGLWHTFVIVPASDVHLDCRPVNIVRSLQGLPYPSLQVFAQSCLNRRNELELCDLIDGTNISEDWGEKNLNLEGTNDVDWAWAMKRRTKEWNVEKEGKPRPIDFWPTRPKSKRLIWQSQVRTKASRLDWSRPPEAFITQYRVHGSPDPWTVLSDVS